MTTSEALASLETALKRRGIPLTVSNRSVTTSSIYCMFDVDVRIGSLTVRDHPGKEKYRYKWNLHKGHCGDNHVVIDDGVTWYIYNFDQIKEMADHIANYYAAVKKEKIKLWKKQSSIGKDGLGTTDLKSFQSL